MQGGIELKSLKADKILDVKGEVCPYPVVMARKALAAMPPGAILLEITDHTISTETVPEAVQQEGLAEVLGIMEEPAGVYHIYMRRQ